jgi:peroxiredoxin
MPPGVLQVLDGSRPARLDAASCFDGRQVVLFSCPGAFTTKSTRWQVPGYVERADRFRELGINDILCITVNDPWVVAAWERHCGATGRVRMLADWDARYHLALGLEMDCLRMRLGWRSQRFSMWVDQGVVRELNVEQPGSYVVSDAAVLLQQIEQQRRAACP